MQTKTISPKVLIHIGYHKTGTTWLQDEIFDNLKYGFVSPWLRKDIIKDFVIPPPFNFQADSTRSKYNLVLKQTQAKNAIPVLSHERLSGYPASGGFDSKALADRLFHTFPDSYVLIVIREQKSMIRSWYAQYIRDGGGLSIQQYLNPPEPGLFRIPWFSYEFYKYDQLINYYQKQFTTNRVIVLPFEFLTKDPLLFVNKITDFMSLPPIDKLKVKKKNIGRGLPWSAITRSCNRFFTINQLNPCGLIDAPVLTKNMHRFASLVNRIFIPTIVHKHLERKMRDYIEKKVGFRYKESNQNTSGMIGIDLQDFGYD